MSYATASPAPGSTLESFFGSFRRHIVGVDHRFESPNGTVPLVYADWTASGRLYGPIERRMADVFGPVVGNTHSESNLTGTTMTRAYHEAHAIIKRSSRTCATTSAMRRRRRSWPQAWRWPTMDWR